MRAVVTVVGKDKVGIIAEVSSFLSKNGLNIEDISQTVLQDFFVMMMLVTVSNDTDIAKISKKLDEKGQELGVTVHIQHEDIFNAMHKI